MEYRLIIRIIINIIIFALLFSCNSPLDIDADRGDKEIIGEKNYDIMLSADTLDFGFVHPNQSKTLSFTINNLTSKDYLINKLTINNFSNLFSLFNFELVLLNKKNSNFDESPFFVTFDADNSYNHYIDSIYINDLKNPDLKILATIPAVYAEDLAFDEVSIGSISSRFLYLHNISDVAITLTNLSTSDNSFIIKGLNNNTLEINPNETIELIVTFEPLIANTYTAYLTFDFKSFPYPVDNTINLRGIAIN